MNFMVFVNVDGKFIQEEISFLMVCVEDWGIIQEEVEVIFVVI